MANKGLKQFTTSSKRVIVIGCNYCNILTISRAFGKAGYTVDVLRVFKKQPSFFKPLSKMAPEKYSKYINSYSQCIAEAGIENYLNISKNQKDKPLLVPVDDYTCKAVDCRYDQLCNDYIIPNVNESSNGIINLMDKSQQKVLAKKIGLPVLSSTLIVSQNGKYVLPDDVEYPCFIKPNVSCNSTKSKMKMCEDKNELAKVLDNYSGFGDFEMLVEKFVNIKNEYSILGVCAKGKVVAPGMFKVVQGGNRSRKGVAVVGETVDTSAYQEIIDLAEKFILSLGYTGMFDIDLIEDVDGRLYFIELNFRAGASTEVLTKAGINLPKLLADSLMFDNDLKIENAIDINKVFVSEKILIEEYARGDISYSNVKKCMDMADVCFIKDDNDLKPYNYFKKFYFVATLMRVLYKIIDKV